jgi:hypothetical protein
MNWRGLTDEAAEGGLAHGGAVHIFAGIHQGEQGAEDAGFEFVGHGKTAGGDVDERFAAAGNFGDEFHLTFVGGIAEGGFAAHFGALIFNEKSEVHDAEMLRG